MTDKRSGEERRVGLLDTSHSLTEEELKELKNLAQLSRTLRWVFAGAFAVIGLFGIDHISDLVGKK